MYYDAEANKYGADYNQLDNTMAFSDVSIRAGRFILSVLNPKEIKIKIQCHFFLSAVLNYASFSFVRLHTKGKLALLNQLKLNFKTAVLELLKTYWFAFNYPNIRVTCFIIAFLWVSTLTYSFTSDKSSEAHAVILS